MPNDKRMRPKDLTQCAVCHGPGEPPGARGRVMYKGVDMTGASAQNTAMDWEFVDHLRKLVLLGSHQLEYQAGRYLYRDIYFGEAYFGGQETVYDHNQLLWTMCYTGGVVSSITSTDHIVKIYAFLRAALLLIVGDRPYRGPQLYNDGSYAYKNESWGMVDCFHGHETITDTDMLVYDLHYSGGFLR